MREWSTRMDNLLLDVDRLLSCDATLSIGKWLQDARNCGATVSEKDYYEENTRCILTVWGQQDTQLNDYANRGWADLPEASTGNVGNVSQTESSLLFRKINLLTKTNSTRTLRNLNTSGHYRKDSFYCFRGRPDSNSRQSYLKIRYVLCKAQ